MAVPTAPTENGGSKIIFASYDGGGTNQPAILRGYQIASINGTNLADLGVYPTSGLPLTGYKATTSSSEIVLATSTPCQGVLVKASPDNTADIWVGVTTLTINKTPGILEGYRLAPGESVGIACRNLASVFIKDDNSAGRQAVYFSASKD